MIYVFGDCVLDTDLYALHRAGHSIRLRPKVFQVLTYLLAHRERVVSRQELCEQVWPDQFISDAALESAIRRARQALGDSGRAQQLIQTLHGHGYRFIAAVTVRHDARPGREAVAAPPPPAPAMKPAQGHTGAIPSSVSPPVSARAAVSSPSDDTAQVLPAAEVSAGERKVVTVLTCTLVHGPALRHRLGLDALHNLMHALYALARSEVYRYGGTLQPIAGDRITALFGVPVTQEDHARRAVLAALGLLQRVSAHQATRGSPPGDTLAVGIGLHTGLVAVGGIGDEAEAAAAVVGDTATLAVALQEHAEPGTILVSDTTARLLRGMVDVEVLGPVPAGEQSTPIVPYKVLGIRTQRAPVAEHEEWTLSRFVGRERELATLHALLAQAEDGQGHVVGIMGDPGIGKSRLLDEFRRSLAARRLTYLRGRCLSYGSATPYLPVLDLLRHNCGMTDVDGPEAITAKVRRSLHELGMAADEWAPYLIQLLGLEAGTPQLAMLSPQAIKVRTFETLIQMSVNGSQQRPLILEVEDLHWIDASSEELLAALVERIAGAPILVLVSYRQGYRPPWLDKSYATQLTLGRLTPRESLQVLQAVFHTEQVPEALAQEILTKADGNPLFLEELARTVVEQGDRHLPLAVPDTIHAVLAARIDRLPPAEKRLLQAAAVIGKDMALPLLQALAGLPEEELRLSLRYLQAAELFYETRLIPEPTYTFKHVLTQEVAYQSLLQRTREQYHRQIAQVVEERFPEIAATQPEWLAQHYTAAGLTAQAIPYWWRAGQRSIERSACVEAIGHLTKGLEILLTLPETDERIQRELTLQTALGQALIATKGQGAPEVEHAYARARELCRQVGETPQLFRVLWGLMGFYVLRGQFQTALELGKQLLALAQGLRDTTFLLEAHTGLGTILFLLGELSPAQAHLEQAMAFYGPQQQRSHAFLYVRDSSVVCLSYAALALWLRGYPDQALQSSQEAVTLAQELAHPQSLAYALFYAAVLHQYHRQARATLERAETLMGLAHEQGFTLWLVGGTILRGWAITEQGKGEDGITQMRQGLAAWRTTGTELARPYYLALLAEVHGKIGQVEEGLIVLDEALAAVHNMGERWYEAELYRLKGELLLGLSLEKDAEAEVCFRQSLAIARRQQVKSLELRAAMSLSRLWQQQNKRHGARQLLAEVYGWFTEGFETADLQEAKALLETLA